MQSCVASRARYKVGEQSALSKLARNNMIDIMSMASPVEKSTGDATFQNWRAAGETSRSFRHDTPPFCFTSLRAPSISLSSGLLRIKRATWSKSRDDRETNPASGRVEVLNPGPLGYNTSALNHSAMLPPLNPVDRKQCNTCKTNHCIYP